MSSSGGVVDASSSYTLVEREVGAWTDRYGMLFVDSPVGTGFSVAGVSRVIYICTHLRVCMD